MSRSKSSKYDTGHDCYTPTPEDYTFIPRMHLYPGQIVGVNCDKPYVKYDNAGQRRQERQRQTAWEFQQRVEKGEHLFPRYENRRSSSFGINEYQRFNFGYPTYQWGERKPLPEGVVNVVHNYSHEANFRIDDEVIVIMRTDNHANTNDIQVLL